VGEKRLKDAPPPKETCLQMARYHHEIGRNDLMLYWLICWAAYDDWLELYWSKK
jgi:hypothetical protein